MKKTFSGRRLLASGLCLLASALCAWAAPEEYVTRAASGSTSATVYFEPSPIPGALLVADVTSDKAASVLSWRIGTNQVSILADVASGDTNLLTTIGNITSNAALVSVTAAGVVTAHAAHTNSFVTNAIVYLENVIGTNLTTTSIAREVTSTNYTIIGTSSTNVVNIVSNTALVTYLGVGTNFLFAGYPSQVETNQVKSWITNAGNVEITLSNAFAFTPQKAHVLTPTLYTNKFTALASATTVILSGSNNLAAADYLVFLPSTGGASLVQIHHAEPYRYQYQNLQATAGLALAAGDRLFVLATAVTTPVGAATLRLMADPVRVFPANTPAVLSIDGTSACAVNTAIVRNK
jgi:hypothetical protein